MGAEGSFDGRAGFNGKQAADDAWGASRRAVVRLDASFVSSLSSFVAIPE